MALDGVEDEFGDLLCGKPIELLDAVLVDVLGERST